MAGLMTQVGGLVRRLAGSPAMWLYANQLLARGYGFVMTLVIARLCGASSVGAYSALLITCSSPTAPMSLAMANSTTLMATQHGLQVGMKPILRANSVGLLVSAVLAMAGAWGLIYVSGLNQMPQMSPGYLALAVSGLVLALLLGPVVMGMAHGLGLSTPAAKLVCVVQVLALGLVYPLVSGWGLPAALALTVWVSMGSVMVLALGRSNKATPANVPDRVALRQEAFGRLRQAVPNVLSTVLNNATNWLACIYLAGRYHGHDGVALVAISLQWLALVQMPVSSYSGRLMYELAVAHQDGQASLARTMRRAVIRCLLITAGMLVLVGGTSPWIADLYRIDREWFVSLVLLGGGAAVMSGFTLVYERVFFCLHSQRPWLLFSTLAYFAQLALTFALIPRTILAVPLGNALGIGVLALSVHVYLKRVAFQPQGGV